EASAEEARDAIDDREAEAEARALRIALVRGDRASERQVARVAAVRDTHDERAIVDGPRHAYRRLAVTRGVLDEVPHRDAEPLRIGADAAVVRCGGERDVVGPFRGEL